MYKVACYEIIVRWQHDAFVSYGLINIKLRRSTCSHVRQNGVHVRLHQLMNSIFRRMHLINVEHVLTLKHDDLHNPMIVKQLQPIKHVDF